MLMKKELPAPVNAEFQCINHLKPLQNQRKQLFLLKRRFG